MFISVIRNTRKIFLCKIHRVRLWFCPIFLFALMGIIIIVTMILFYLFGNNYFDPEIVVFFVSAFSISMFVIGYLVISSFDRLVAVNKLQSEFVAVASHGLHSPISSIKWSVEMMMKDANKSAILRPDINYLDIVEDNTDKIIKMVNNLLDISRLESDDFYLKRELVDLCGIVQKVVRFLTPVAELKNIRISNSCGGQKKYMVLVDSERIESVARNLIDNAIKYSSEGGTVFIDVSLDGDDIRFAVSDQGFGIPKKQQKFIFRKFFRADNAMKYKTEGIGLGLFITKSIIDKSGGKIGFISKNGNGATFWFTLPAAGNFIK